MGWLILEVDITYKYQASERESQLKQTANCKKYIQHYQFMSKLKNYIFVHVSALKIVSKDMGLETWDKLLFFYPYILHFLRFYKEYMPGMVAYPCSTSTWEAEGGGLL